MTVDVNEAFTAERRNQIASEYQRVEDAAAAAARQRADFAARVANGSMRDLGGGRFEATTGWDAGEVWTVRQTAAGEMVLPQHGLKEQADGRVLLYSAVPLWHELATVIPGGISSIEAVLGLAGLDHQVIKRPVRDLTRAGELREYPEKYFTVREDTDEILGVVGKGYTIIQGVEQFRFLQDLHKLAAGTDHPVVWESAGQLANGRVFVSMRLGEDIIIDGGGIADPIRPFLSAINSHDGESSFKSTVSPWRIGCGNTERFNLRDARSTWSTPHTKNAQYRLEKARHELGMTSKYYEEFAAEQTALAQTRMRIGEFAAFADEWAAEFWEVAEAEVETDRQAKGRKDRTDALVGRFEENAAQLGLTAYAAERAVTQWLDWDTGVKVSKTLTEELVRANKVMNGDNDRRKTRAHEKLMLRVR